MYTYFSSCVKRIRSFIHGGGIEFDENSKVLNTGEIMNLVRNIRVRKKQTVSDNINANMDPLSHAVCIM